MYLWLKLVQQNLCFVVVVVVSILAQAASRILEARLVRLCDNSARPFVRTKRRHELLICHPGGSSMGFRWIRQILKSLRQLTLPFDPVVLAGTLFGYAALWRAGFDANHRFLVLLVATVMGRAAVWFISRRDRRP
jgi:hypothetical protein